MTTEATPAAPRSLDDVTKWAMLAWIAVGFVYFATQFDHLSAGLVYVWLTIQALLTVVHIALGVRR